MDTLKYTHRYYVRSIGEGNSMPKAFKKSLNLTTNWKINCNRSKYGSRGAVRKPLTTN